MSDIDKKRMMSPLWVKAYLVNLDDIEYSVSELIEPLVDELEGFEVNQRYYSERDHLAIIENLKAEHKADMLALVDEIMEEYLKHGLGERRFISSIKQRIGEL